MPQVQRSDLPEALFRHLAARVKQRSVTVADLKQLSLWLDTFPEVPEAAWFKRFPTFVTCGEGALIKTFLEAKQTAVGTEIY